MTDYILNHEPGIRLGFFFGILLVMAVWEALSPRRALTVSKTMRWVNNLGIVFLNSALMRLIFPAAAVGVAVFAQTRGWGFFNYFDAPFWLAVVVSVAVLDFAIRLKLRHAEGSELCPLSTMKDLYELVRDSDRVVTF